MKLIKDNLQDNLEYMLDIISKTRKDLELLTEQFQTIYPVLDTVALGVEKVPPAIFTKPKTTEEYIQQLRTCLSEAVTLRTNQYANYQSLDDAEDYYINKWTKAINTEIKDNEMQ